MIMYDVYGAMIAVGAACSGVKGVYDGLNSLDNSHKTFEKAPLKTKVAIFAATLFKHIAKFSASFAFVVGGLAIAYSIPSAAVGAVVAAAFTEAWPWLLASTAGFGASIMINNAIKS